MSAESGRVKGDRGQAQVVDGVRRLAAEARNEVEWLEQTVRYYVEPMTQEQRAELDITPEQARRILKNGTAKVRRATCLMLLTALTPPLLPQGEARAAAEARAEPLAPRRQLPPPARASRNAAPK